MEYYRINQQRPKKEIDRFPPPRPEDHRWHGVRSFWSKSFKGVHAADYDAGVALSQEDFANEDTANRDALDAVVSQDRDNVWQAKRDGYNDNVKKKATS